MMFTVAQNFRCFSRTRKLNDVLEHLQKSRKRTSCLCVKRFTTQVDIQSDSDGKNRQFVTFDEVLKKRQFQAKKSIIVQVHSKDSCVQLHEHCTAYGRIVNMLHYNLLNASNFVIVEFENEFSVQDLIRKSSHFDQHQVIPVRSQFLWFKENLKHKKDTKVTKSLLEKLPLSPSSTVQPPEDSQLQECLFSCGTLPDQMNLLVQKMQLDDLGVRIRFLTACQIQNALSGLFPLAQAIPYGSTVNNFGKLGCDLDVAIQLDHSDEKETNGHLILHAKTSLATSRSQQQRSVDMLGDLVQLVLPGCNNVRKVLHARVPIIRYRQELTGIECDLSLTNMTAVYMSEMLYIFSSIDPRVRPLVYTIRYWAHTCNLTNSTPGHWITNFSLTLLTIFYLQHAKILPSLNHLVKIARPIDKRSVETVNCTFLRDISNLQSKTPVNTSDLSDLLLGFFEFYASFDFSSLAINLGVGKPVPKQEFSALHLVNPLETHLNVSKNMNLQELERIKVECLYATAYLSSKNYEYERNNNEVWGLLNIFFNSNSQRRLKSKLKTNRLIAVSDIFKEDVN